ncbi:MAG TPA: hypothetical protein VK612_08110 [Pyrinomonadaceae bacterium]|nr:hypothetical protein [Pyrinomonadaceae bacterium]
MFEITKLKRVCMKLQGRARALSSSRSGRERDEPFAGKNPNNVSIDATGGAQYVSP